MNKKESNERKIAYESLPPIIRESLTPEETELFLTADQWPEELFKKLDEFIVRD